MTRRHTRRRFLSGLAAGTVATVASGRGFAGGRGSDASAKRTDWPMYAQDPVNTGQTGSDGPEEGVSIGWEADVSAATPPAVVGNTVYVGTGDGVYALAVDSGEKAWSVNTDAAATTCPAVAKSLVYAGTAGGVVHAFDASNGTEKWTYDAGAEIVSAPAVQTNRDLLFVADDDGGVYQLDSLSGIEEWNQSLDGSITGSLAASNETTTIYVPGSGELRGLDLRVGDVRWTTSFGGSVTTPSAPGATGYLGSGDLHEFDARDGGANWSRSLEGSVEAVPAYSDQVVYAATDRGYVYAFEVGGDLSRRWRARVDGAVTTAPAVSRGSSTLYVGDDTGTVYAFDVGNGNERWSAQLSVGTPELAVAGGSVIAVGDGVVALESGSKTRITTETPTPTPAPPTETATPTEGAEPTTTTPPPNELTTTPPPTEPADSGAGEGTPTATPTPTRTPTTAPSTGTGNGDGGAGGDGGGGDGAGDGGAATTTSGSGDLAPWLTLAGIAGLGALGVRGSDEDGAD